MRARVQARAAAQRTCAARAHRSRTHTFADATDVEYAAAQCAGIASATHRQVSARQTHARTHAHTHAHTHNNSNTQ
jgi:hypothetical protein